MITSVSLNNRSIFERMGISFLFGFGKKIASDDPFAKLPKATNNTSADCSGKTALIVDDNNLNLRFISKSLSKYKFKIVTSTSGKDCIKKVSSGEHYDIIFMDSLMPDMDGIEVLDELKKIPDITLPPVIVLTANAIAGVKERYMSAGFSEFLAKPINVNELDRVINLFFKN